MRSFSNHDITLFILDLTQHLTQLLDFQLKWVTWGFTFGNVDDAVDIEGNLFCGGGPVFVGEAVNIFAVGVSVEGVVARGDGALMDEVVASGVLNL